MPKAKESVAAFYRPVMADQPKEVQELVVRLLGGEFKESSDLEEAILLAAQSATDSEASE